MGLPWGYHRQGTPICAEPRPPGILICKLGHLGQARESKRRETISDQIWPRVVRLVTCGCVLASENTTELMGNKEWTKSYG